MSAAWPDPAALIEPDVLHRDDRLVILNKPSGLPSHAGPRGGRSVEDWFPSLSRRKDGPWLAHRLDADTSGCLVVALKKTALIAIQAAFAAGRVRKTYWAVCRGAPPRNAGGGGTQDAPVARITSTSGWRMAVDPAGQSARTHWRILGLGQDVCWLELDPRTGRTHQIRVHCAALGCPVVGDPVYGDGKGRLQLLARSISLPLEPGVCATAPLPAHMRGAFTAAGWDACLTPAGTTV